MATLGASVLKVFFGGRWRTIGTLGPIESVDIEVGKTTIHVPGLLFEPEFVVGNLPRRYRLVNVVAHSIVDGDFLLSAKPTGEFDGAMVADLSLAGVVHHQERPLGLVAVGF